MNMQTKIWNCSKLTARNGVERQRIQVSNTHCPSRERIEKDRGVSSFQSNPATSSFSPIGHRRLSLAITASIDEILRSINDQRTTQQNNDHKEPRVVPRFMAFNSAWGKELPPRYLFCSSWTAVASGYEWMRTSNYHNVYEWIKLMLWLELNSCSLKVA